MRPALGCAQHTVSHHSFLRGAARTVGGAGRAGSGGQGFGPRPGVRRREGGHQRRQAGGGRSGARSPAAAAAAGHNPQPTLEEVEDSGWEGAQQVQAQASEPEPAPQADGGGGGDGTMHGQPHYKAGLPSSRSDTMLLQTEEQQRYGLLGSGMGSAGPGLARHAPGQHSMPAVGAAVVAGAAPPCAAKPSNNSIPVYVMLPLDTVNADGVFRYASSKWFSAALQRLAATGIRGVAVDVWWGAVERRPRRYDWAGYRQLFALVRALGLKLQVVMSFHACGGNVGDNAQIPLPQWVLQVGESDPDIFFTDRPRDVFPGQRNRECISFFAEEEPGLLRGRSPMQCYVEFMRAFRDEFLLDLGSLIEEVVVGCGPCGELRYPSYPEANGWRFPGVGEFQCYDRRALASLAAAAREAGHPEWGNTGPHDAGSYNSSPEDTGFFCSWGGKWETPYGRFFMEWYSGTLLDHGERMLTAATSVFNTRRSAASGSWIGGSRSRSLPELPGSGGGSAPGSSNARQHVCSLPPLPSGVEEQYALEAAAGAEQRQGSPAGGDAAEPMQVTQQAQQAQRGEEGAAGAAGSGGDGPPDAERLQQQQQQAAAEAALHTSPSLDMLTSSAAPSPRAPPMSAPPPAGLGMRHHASYSSLRSSVSESEEWLGEGGPGCVPAGPAVHLTLKVAGVHWWFRTRSHAAELTAGYYNTDQRDGYTDILKLCARHGASLTLTCVEMCDAQHPPEALCGPEGLLRQVRERAAAIGVPVAGENALPCFMPNIIDETALHRIVYNTQPWGTPLQTGAGSSGLDPAGPVAAAAAAAAAAAGNVHATAAGAGGSNSSSPVVPSPGGSSGSSDGSDSPSSSGDVTTAKLPPMRAFTFLRLTDMMMTEDYQRYWARFMRLMAQNKSGGPLARGEMQTFQSWRRSIGFE